MVRTLKRDKNADIPVELYVRSAPDPVYFVLTLILVSLGAVMLFSAGSAYTVEGEILGNLEKHLIYVGAGMVGAFIIVFSITPNFGKIFGIALYAVTVVFLVWVLFFGVSLNGARRWIDLYFFWLQPSELAKTALVLVLALYFSKNTDRFRWRKGKLRAIVYGIIIPLLLTGVFCGLVIAEKHLSGTLIILAIGIIMMFLGGSNILMMLIPGIAAGVGLGLFAWNTPYTRERIEGLFYRGANGDGDLQTTQGLYAMGTGGFFGRGIGNSQLKNGYIPEVQNDFIFTVVAEELGYFGAVTVILLFLAVIGRGIRLSQQTSDRFVSLTVAGLSMKLAIHVLFNIGVVTAVLPNTGISLPYFSSGGTATIVQLIDAGIILGLSRYCNEKKSVHNTEE